MVVKTSASTQLKFTHFVDITSTKCSIGTAREVGSKKLKLFLLSEDNRVYQRDGIKQSWVQMDDRQYEQLCEFVRQSIQDESIPHFQTSSININ